jgi:IPT/TIG domain
VSGQHVTIFGRDLVGPGGYLVATFDGAPVPTSCPSEEQCTAVVPPRPPGATAIVVRLRTGTAVSNVVTFHYT